MDNLNRIAGAAALAQIEIDCPWCAEPVRATADELEAGLTCRGCSVRIELFAPTRVDAPAALAA